MDKVKTILDQFRFKGKFVGYNEFGSGHINRTFLATYDDSGKIIKYVVQQINDTVFKNVEKLMDNVFEVTSFLRAKIKEYGGDTERETLHYIMTKDDNRFYKTDDGKFFRAYVFVKDSVSYDSVDSAEIFKSSGKAFGKFQRLLADYPADTLFETIPDFHNTKWRYEEFEKAVKNNKSGRAENCKEEIEFVRARQKDCSVLVDMTESGDLPLRVTHNDTKLNNVMFDENTNECVCVIDLDTVMPGLALYDFGDSIRFGANTAVEDESDLSKVSLNLEYFKAYAEGFLSEAGQSLYQSEIDYLAFASKIMTLECGMRFLGDYINGDVYFNTEYDEHNLVRANNQFKLVYDMEQKMDKMEEIINKIKYDLV